MKEKISRKLIEILSPIYFYIEDESKKHIGHRDSPGHNEGTHFSVFIVSQKFVGLNRIERSKLVHQLLVEELKHNIHAFSLKALTPHEYSQKNS